MFIKSRRICEIHFCSKLRILIKFTSVKFLPNTGHFSCKVCQWRITFKLWVPGWNRDEIEQWHVTTEHDFCSSSHDKNVAILYLFRISCSVKTVLLLTHSPHTKRRFLYINKRKKTVATSKKKSGSHETVYSCHLFWTTYVFTFDLQKYSLRDTFGSWIPFKQSIYAVGVLYTWSYWLTWLQFDSC